MLRTRYLGSAGSFISRYLTLLHGLTCQMGDSLLGAIVLGRDSRDAIEVKYVPSKSN